MAQQSNFLQSIVENFNLLDLATVRGWFKINDDQSITWTAINNTQSITWSNIGDDQTPNWVQIDNSQA
jgi:hypothetical protein